MTSVFAYGSLIHPSEYAVMFPSAANDAIPVRLDGFTRTFEQETTFRGAAGNGDATLTVTRDASSWVNGILIPNVSETELAEYEEREEGYTLERVPAQEFEPYSSENQRIVDECKEVIVPVGNRKLDTPTPVPEYLALATTGASLHGDEFLTDFVLTTHKLARGN